MNTYDNQQRNVTQVRFGTEQSVASSISAFPKRTQVELFCYRHPDRFIHQGCTALNCQKMIMCPQCNTDDDIHYQEHKEDIVEFPHFLEILASEIKKVNRNDSMLYNKNVKQLLEKEHTYLLEYDNLCKKQVKYFNQLIDDQTSLIMQHFYVLRQTINAFFDSNYFNNKQIEQFNTFSNNIHFFKTQYQQINPEETLARYGDVPQIVAKLYAKNPQQCFHFLNNLRKSANMEGQLLSDLDYISNMVLRNYEDSSFFLQEFALNQLKNSVADMIDQTKIAVNDSLKQIPKLTQDVHASVVSQAFISYNRHQVKLAQPELFENRKFRFANVAQIQTHHSNSVTALVALSHDILATSSYDRTIKIWKISSGELLKTIYDTCCISSMISLKIKNDKNTQADSYTDEENSQLHNQILKGNLSNSGFYLITGGFDKQIKVWDFDIMIKDNQYEMDRIAKYESSLLSQSYNLSVFPIHTLKGHNSWITALLSFNDERNIAAGDDSGEVIVWDIINQVLLYRLTHIRNPGIVPFLSLTIPFQQFCCSSGTYLRIYSLFYKSQEEIYPNPKFKERLEAKFAPKKNPIQIAPQLSNVQLDKEIDIFWGVTGCISPSNYPNLLIVFGNQPNKLKYVMLNKNKVVEINTDNETYCGQLLLIEKHRIHDTQMDQFYKNINFIMMGDKSLAVYDGYGTKIRALESQMDDLYASNILCQRNMQILKLEKRSVKKTLKFACVSQYGTQDYKYKSARITLFEISYDTI
ncbi:unnamed protein product [Paramecium octaurelia]|uniref:Uncharacterized protein n=1 Tax=Paramecium octaurelia TaxID=43137 RepID=A0A8S1V0I3_PAROT|nr:unnamed protein product [Paramecium octaurelia]